MNFINFINIKLINFVFFLIVQLLCGYVGQSGGFAPQRRRRRWRRRRRRDDRFGRPDGQHDPWRGGVGGGRRPDVPAPGWRRDASDAVLERLERTHQSLGRTVRQDGAAAAPQRL